MLVLVASPPSTNCIVTGLEISIVITTVVIPNIIACPLNSVSIVAHGRFDVIVAGSVVRGVVVPSLETEENWDRNLSSAGLRLISGVISPGRLVFTDLGMLV